MLHGFFKILLLLFPPLALSCVGRISSRFLLRMVPWSQGLSLHKRGKWGRVPSPERGSGRSLVAMGVGWDGPFQEFSLAQHGRPLFLD